MHRLLIRLLRARSRHRPCYAAGRNRELVTVRLADGRIVEGERAGSPGGGQGRAPATVYDSITLGGARRGWLRRLCARVPWWVRWSAGTVVVVLVFRRAVAWALVTGLSGALHLMGVSAGLPRIAFGWPWSPLTAPAATSNLLAGPLVLQKIEGIDSPALGTTTFGFLFTRTVSHPMGLLPCWYSATFYTVAKASATVDLNLGPAWWAPTAGHFALTVLSQPSGGTPGRVSVTMTLPEPRLPQTVHDVSVDNTLSRPASTDHSWTYPGLACGVLIRPQFAQSALFAQAQAEAFTQATTLKSVTAPLIAAAEKEATAIIGGNFITPVLSALGYTVASFTLRWAAPAG